MPQTQWEHAPPRVEAQEPFPGSLKDCPPSEPEVVGQRVRGYLQITHLEEGRVHVEPLTASRYLIGSGPTATIRLHHAAIAPLHAELVSAPFGRWWIRDCAPSRNQQRPGLLVQGQPVTEHVLRHGEGVKMGSFLL